MIGIAREGLHQRFTPAAVKFMRACLDEALRRKTALNAPLRTEALNPFARVMLFDSSSWDVDTQLRTALPGSGGAASAANCKLQACYEYKHGELGFFRAAPGIHPDQAHSSALPGLVAKHDLVLIDMGYFKLRTFRQFHDQGTFFLSRLLVSTSLYQADTREPVDLAVTLGRFIGNELELPVLLGSQKDDQTPCRLICLRAGKAVANERRRKLLKEAKKQGRTPSQKHLKLCAWTLFVTNASGEMLPASMAHPSWQIELIFKQRRSLFRFTLRRNGRTCTGHTARGRGFMSY